MSPLWETPKEKLLLGGVLGEDCCVFMPGELSGQLWLHK